MMQKKKESILSGRSTDFILSGQSDVTLIESDRNFKPDLSSKLLARLISKDRDRRSSY